MSIEPEMGNGEGIGRPSGSKPMPHQRLRAWGRLGLLVAAALVTLSTDQAWAGGDPAHPSTRTAGLGGASVGLSAGLGSLGANPAGLLGLRGAFSLRTDAMRPFGISELAGAGGAVARPTRFGTVAVSGARSGFELYRETSLGLSFARRVVGGPGLGLELGMTVAYRAVALGGGFGSDATFGVDAGARVPLIAGLSWGVAATNLNAPSWGRGAEPLAQTLSTGLAYDPSTVPLVLVADLVRDTRYPAAVRLGVEGNPVRPLTLRLGLATLGSPTADGAALWTAGVGVALGPVVADYAFQSHPVLGASHGVGLSLAFGAPPVAKEPVAPGDSAAAPRRTARRRSTKLVPGETVELNSADSTALARVPGISPALAARIVAYREAKGPFGRIDELLYVRGVGNSTLVRIRPYLRLDRTTPSAPAVPPGTVH